MNTENIGELFIKASRKKTRISTNRGTLAVEDLWDLSLKALDALAVDIDEGVDKTAKKSFLASPDKRAQEKQQEIKDILAIVVYVIESKQAENEAKLQKNAKEKQVDFLRSLKKRKELESLEGLSEAEIDKRIADLS